MRTRIFLIFFLFLFLSANTAQAAIFEKPLLPEVMPDSKFYKIKIWYERIITFFSFGDIRRAKRYSTLAERRLYEAERMAEKGKVDLAKKLLEEYEKYLNKAFGKVEEAKQEAEKKVKQRAKEKANQAIEMISESTLENQEILLRIYELVPDDAKDVVEGVIKVTRTGYEWAIDTVSGIKKEELRQKADQIKIRAQGLLKSWKEIFEE